MGIPTGSAWLILVTTLSSAATSTAASCKYSPESRLMDCRKVSLMFLQVGKYPLNDTSVQVLSLWNTGLSELKENVFGKLTDLETLSLGSNLLVNLHHNVFSTLSQLRSLDLSYNKIASLTDNRLFASQKNLLYLHLESNQLTTLPAEVLYPMVSLHRLYLSFNLFVCNCQLLPTMMWCQQKCLITEATCNVPANYTWETWSASHNETCAEPSETVSEKPSCAYACLYTKSFEMMDCRNILITSLKAGKAPLHVISLSVLNFRNTNLTEIEPHAFSQLKRLTILYLNYNQLEILDYRIFANLTELTFIDLSNNRLLSLPDERIFASLGKLEILLLNSNRLTTLKIGVVKPLYSLNELHLSGNPLECSCQLYATLQWCKQRGVYLPFSCKIPGGFRFIPRGTLEEGRSCDTPTQSNPTTELPAKSTLPSTVTANINVYTKILLQVTTDSNHIDSSDKNDSEISSSPFSCIYTTTYHEKIDCSNSDLGGLSVGKYPLNVTSLDTLNLHNTGLTALEPHVFNRLRSLRVLYLSGNQLQHLHYRLFENLTELCLLDLSYNLLVSLPPGTRTFRSQGKLETLALNNNQLTYIDEGLLKPLHSLRKLYLSGNPFTCDCRLHAAVLLSEERYIFTDATCNWPAKLRGAAWQILKEKESCDSHEQQGVPRDVALPIVVVCLVLFCGLCALFGFCCWCRRRRCITGHQGKRMHEYDDVGLSGLGANVPPHAQVPDYASILSDLPNSATNVSSSRSNISSHVYDYVAYLESKEPGTSHLVPRSQCPSAVASSHAYDDVRNQIPEQGSYVLPNSA
ncbi:slit homolog 1 protein-like isoform X1 [Cryptotermes secundus]|uniref:slit homolog 1 protein-like isoform X1 n=1 Tax=Cryptotermes secundus TaxID=105785 RepID=UPI000CD7C33E|nr:slit homolog 1 protein-like isoform X1 [Cryptotermes secundus]